MRLLQSEADAIKSTFLALFHSGKIYLFGSRVDDSKKGGDIDLFLELDDDLSLE
ncbi:MAG TPA: nucleotidyltransferase domain-containing protein, partial [Epsilonproteobacteria bacterium]|nr:nucleotidyltransferase domain-containing protein [Campylobacterota bacterium]